MLNSSRVVRVFISSTFRDMVRERDILVKRIFPQLRKLCEERFVTWGEVDLRWGVPDEKKAEGKVLPICLEEIRRCRPYFIGILGERYGSLPEELPRDLLDREPWLKGHLKHSLTELEIWHGVLNDPKMADHSFFYFRDPGYLNRLPKEANRSDFTSESPEAAEKLAQLKDRIRASGLPVRENYTDPERLSELVLEDLTKVINEFYPPESKPDPLDREAMLHEAFARSRARVYIGRDEYFKRLDEHASGDGPPLVVLGESGSGKSALLANWALSYREAHPKDLIVLHFIGASPASSDWPAMLRRILGEFKRRYGFRDEIPDKPDALRAAFANWLHMAAAKGRVILMLDALNQLEDRDGAPDLVWLPPVVPDNIRLFLSTLPGRPLEDLKKRDWPTLAIQPFTTAERARFVTDYLVLYGRELSPAHASLIAEARQTENPLFLQAMLEELRLFGNHEELESRIKLYLTAKDIPALFELILARYEGDYEDDRPGLVRDAMNAIWAARRGLSESELLDLLGKDDKPLPRAYWSPLFLAAEQALVSKAGLLNFFHDHLRAAVRNRYVSKEQQQSAAHLRLADYFERQEPGLRRTDELPWQLAEAKSWQRLFDLLADLEFFEQAWNANQFDLKAYWAQVEAGSNLQMTTAYRPMLDAPDRVPNASWISLVGTLLADTGHPAEALSLRTFLTDHFRKAGDRNNYSASLGNQAVILYARGDLDGAMKLHKEQERICRELGDKAGLHTSLGSQATVLHVHGDLDEAMKLYREKERICRELGDKDGLQHSLGNQALILEARGDLDGAMKLHKGKERICRELGNKAGLSVSLGNQAVVLHVHGDLDEAMKLYREKERICRELGDKSGLQNSLGNQAVILNARGNLDGAMKLHKEQERICRELGNKNSLQRSLGNQAIILRARGDLDGAMKLHKEEELICRELGNKGILSVSLGNQATVLYDRGDLDGAMKLYREQERICRELGTPEHLGYSLANQAELLSKNRNRPREALPLAEEAYRIASEHSYAALAGLINPLLDSIRAKLKEG